MATLAPSTIDQDDVERFSAMAENWWDPSGPFAPLHALNPVRLSFLKDTLCAHLGRDPAALKPFSGLSILDAGCGGGLLCEPLARLGASVTGIDASPTNIEVAALHASQAGLEIDYRESTVEALRERAEPFDVVLAMEVVEHVSDITLFVEACADLTKPGGLLVGATLNRTAKSLALAKIGAEYVLRWLPAGTHDWRKFVKPAEFARMLRTAGLHVDKLGGIRFDPLRRRWSLSDSLDVNYMIVASKP